MAILGPEALSKREAVFQAGHTPPFTRSYMSTTCVVGHQRNTFVHYVQNPKIDS